LPIAVTRAGNVQIFDAGFTKNISSSGVLFTAQTELNVGGSIEYVITLIKQSKDTVNVKCIGRVVRQVNDSDPHVVAVTVDRYEFVRVRALAG
jgi:hypothetical protein